MITFISGVPGSGKTFLAVIEMLKDKKPIHTNIEIKKDIKFEKFTWKNFYEKITFLYGVKEDSELAIQKSKDLGIYGISIYYDECHLEMSAQDKIVIWWLSWHRHLDQNICLITQSKGTLAQKYRAYPEIFVDAHPATKRIFGNVMRYSEYASYRMNKDELIRKFSIKIDPKVFEYYRTGATNKGSNSLRKKLWIILLFFSVPIIFFIYLISSFGNDREDDIIVSDVNLTKVIDIIPDIKIAVIPNIINCDISGKWFHYEGWVFHRTHPLVKEILSKPRKTHTITSYYHKFQYSQKYVYLFDMLIANKSNSFQ